MINYSDFVDKWRRIPHQSRNTYLSIEVKHPLRIQIGNNITGQKSLVIMNTGIMDNIPSSYSIKASNPRLKNGSYVLEFQLIYNSLEDTFYRLCWDMIDFSAQSKAPLDAMINRYLSWQKMLKQINKKVLSFENQKGLLGELLYLEKSIDEVGSMKSLNSWVGPDGSDQDFIFDNSWTEVKTVSAAAESIRISSLEQLNQTDNGTLAVYSLEKTTPGINRVSLNQVVDRLRNRLNTDQLSKDHFELKLFKYGYRDDERDSYDLNVFRLIGESIYEVNKDFPKLTRDNVPSEITNCSYQISIAAIEQFRRSDIGLAGI